MLSFQQYLGILLFSGGLLGLALFWRLERALNSTAKSAGAAAKTISKAALRNPGSTVRGGLELWKILHK